MPAKEELERIMAWCEQVKRERGRSQAIERHPFGEEMPWTRRFPFIEIDRRRETAAKTNLVYDSTTRSTWEFLNGLWRRLEPEMPVEK